MPADIRGISSEGSWLAHLYLHKEIVCVNVHLGDCAGK